MDFPIPIAPSLSSEFGTRWDQFLVQASDRKRTQEEGIWRRTQTSENAEESNWTNPSDQRRRIVHYLHDFDLVAVGDRFNLVMSRTYVYYSLSLPKEELEIDRERILNALSNGGWSRSRSTANCWQLADLECVMREFDAHPEDLRARRTLPSGYRSVDFTIRTPKIGNVEATLPWQVLAGGMRIKDRRGAPIEVEDLSILSELTPFHVEIGCGVSLEAGIPALRHLHELYAVTELDTGKFIFGGQRDDLLPRLLGDPPREFPKLASLFSASFKAEPTLALRAMRALKESGRIVGPIMTNNFDGLAHRAGLPERFLRRYDEITPTIEFDDQAKALLVIGSHADRRRVQARARAQGLQVVFLDPEGYSIGGRFSPYPLEGAKDGDMLCRKTAAEGLGDLCYRLGILL
ncbi:MAG: hypothetical protein ABL996_09500 [Micropepsaceae bacterium]